MKIGKCNKNLEEFKDVDTCPYHGSIVQKIKAMNAKLILTKKEFKPNVFKTESMEFLGLAIPLSVPQFKKEELEIEFGDQVSAQTTL